MYDLPDISLHESACVCMIDAISKWRGPPSHLPTYVDRPWRKSHYVRFHLIVYSFRAEPGAERRAQFRYTEEGVLLVFSRGKADPAIILAAALAYFSASRR